VKAQQLDLQRLRGGDNCAYYQEQRDYETTMAGRHATLIVLVALTTVAALIAAIFAISIVHDTGRVLKLVSVLGTVVGAVATSFLFDQRKGHQSRAATFAKAIDDDNCP
jgi:hypothetical protein